MGCGAFEALCVNRASLKEFVLGRVFIAVKRLHDHGSSYKEDINWDDWLTVSGVQCTIIMAGSMGM